MKPTLLIEQKVTPFVNRYLIYKTTSNGQEKGDLFAFAEQKRVRIKEKIIFYDNTEKQNVVFMLRAEKALDVHGRYFIENSQGDRLGAFKKEFGKSLLVSSWQILGDNNEPKLRIVESNKFLAIVRRFVGFIPIIGEIIDVLLALLLKYHFDIIDIQTGELVGKYRKITAFRDHYSFDLDDATEQSYDHRVFAALGVALDALQSR